MEFVASGIKYPLKIRPVPAGVEVGFEGVVKQEVPFYRLPALVGALEFVGMGLPFRESVDTVAVLPSTRLGYTRIRVRRKDEDGWFYTDVSNREALALSDYLSRLHRTKNTASVAFTTQTLHLSKGNGFYKLRAIYGQSVKTVKLSEREKSLLAGALKNAVFGRYVERRITLPLKRGFVQIYEKFEVPEEWEEKIEKLWEAVAAKGKYPPITIRELLRQKGVEFRSFIRVRVGENSNEDKILVPLPLTFAYGFARVLEVL